MVVVTHDATTGMPRTSWRDFFLRRLVRVLPLLWVAVLSYAALRYFGAGVTDFSGALRAFFVWPIGDVDPNVTWTIRHEVLFYIVFSFFFLAVPRLRAYSAVWFLAPLAGSLLLPVASSDGMKLLQFLVSPYNLEFGLGVAAGFMHQRIPARVPQLRFQLAWLFLLVVGFRTLMGVVDGIEDRDVGRLSHVLMCLPFCFVALALAVRTDPARTLKLMMFLGDASYSIFLFHPHILSPALLVLRKIDPSMPTWIAASVCFIVCVGLASIIHVLIEKPILARAHVFIHRIPSSPKRSAAAS